MSERPLANPAATCSRSSASSNTEADEAEAACTNFAHAWALLSQDAWMMEHEAERMARIQQLGDCDL